MTSTEERRSTCAHNTKDTRNQTRSCARYTSALMNRICLLCAHCPLLPGTISRDIAVHGRGLKRPGGRPASCLTCTYSGSRLTALLMAHTLNCTSVSSAVALLLNLQDT